MEKRTIIIAILLFLFGLIISFQGCQKKEVKTTKSDSVEISIKRIDIEKSNSVLNNTDTVSVYFQYEPLIETLKLIELGLSGENQAAGGNINFEIVKLEYDLLKKRIDYAEKKKKTENETVEMFRKHYNNCKQPTISSTLDDICCKDFRFLSMDINESFNIQISERELKNAELENIKDVSGIILNKIYIEP